VEQATATTLFLIWLPDGSTLMTTSMSEVAALGTVLGIWAHPDDEAYLSGGLMALARAGGQRVVCVTATRGEHGTPDPVAWPPARLAAERTRELARCLDLLGVREHHWLPYRDGRCAQADAAEAVDRLADLLDQVRPDTVLTFGPDGITGHEDHRTVSAWAGAAFDRAAPPGARLLYAATAAGRAPRWAALDASLGIYPPGLPIVTPDDRLAVDLVLDPDVVARKVRALAAQRTQTSGLIAALGRDRYTAWVAEESFVEPACYPWDAARSVLGGTPAAIPDTARTRIARR
jgi:LmbE family N-acetylglucosaminyl deacetylase